MLEFCANALKVEASADRTNQSVAHWLKVNGHDACETYKLQEAVTLATSAKVPYQMIQNGRQFDEKQNILMKKWKKFIEKYKNRVKKPNPGISSTENNRVKKAKT